MFQDGWELDSREKLEKGFLFQPVQKMSVDPTHKALGEMVEGAGEREKGLIAISQQLCLWNRSCGVCI